MPNLENESAKLAACPEKLRTTIDEFVTAAPRERLEYLLEFSDELPELPDHLLADRDAMEQVHECQSPVFLHTEFDDGHVHFLFDVPQEAPTVRGYAAILQEGFAGASPDEVLNAPEDIYRLLGLDEAISPLRLRGLHALMVYMKRQVQNGP
jgi:cysteine desulfuration protein SufE